jgi:hypothetical protein
VPRLREPRPQLAVQRGYWGWIFEVAQLVDDVLLGYTYNFQADSAVRSKSESVLYKPRWCFQRVFPSK